MCKCCCREHKKFPSKKQWNKVCQSNDSKIKQTAVAVAEGGDAYSYAVLAVVENSNMMAAGGNSMADATNKANVYQVNVSEID